LPIGWSEFPKRDQWLTMALGWLITAFAVSLGAPFWFDLLNKFVNVRASGKAPEEAPKSPKEVPIPKLSASNGVSKLASFRRLQRRNHRNN
jgi:hypothetical protein